MGKSSYSKENINIPSRRGDRKRFLRQIHIDCVKEEARKRDEYRAVPGVSNFAQLAPKWWNDVEKREEFIDTMNQRYA